MSLCPTCTVRNLNIARIVAHLKKTCRQSTRLYMTFEVKTELGLLEGLTPYETGRSAFADAEVHDSK